MLCFSGDNLRLEGTGSAISICEHHLEDIDSLVQAEFYSGGGDRMGLQFEGITSRSATYLLLQETAIIRDFLEGPIW